MIVFSIANYNAILNLIYYCHKFFLDKLYNINFNCFNIFLLRLSKNLHFKYLLMISKKKLISFVIDLIPSFIKLSNHLKTKIDIFFSILLFLVASKTNFKYKKINLSLLL